MKDKKENQILQITINTSDTTIVSYKKFYQCDKIKLGYSMKEQRSVISLTKDKKDKIYIKEASMYLDLNIKNKEEFNHVVVDYYMYSIDYNTKNSEPLMKMNNNSRFLMP